MSEFGGMHQSLARSDRDLEPRRESLVPRRAVSTRLAAPRDAQAARNAPSTVERWHGVGLRTARQLPRAPVDGQRPRARRYRHRRQHSARHAGRRGDVEAYRNARPSTRRTGRVPRARRVRRRIGSTTATRAESETAAMQTCQLSPQLLRAEKFAAALPEAETWPRRTRPPPAPPREISHHEGVRWHSARSDAADA